MKYTRSKLPNESLWYIMSGRKSDIQLYLDDVFDRQRVIFIDDIMMEPFMRTFCKFQSKDPEFLLIYMSTKKLKGKTDLPRYYILKVHDPNIPSVMKGLLLSSLMQSQLYSRTVGSLRRMIEVGLVNKIQDYIDSFDVSDEWIGRDVPERASRAKECMASSVYNKESTLETLKLASFTQLFVYYFLSNTCTTLIWLLEHFYFSKITSATSQ